jgi:carbon storage regulator CsrA
MSNLILTRKKQESVVIYTAAEPTKILCEIVVTSLGPKQVKLAFEAKKEIKIDRKEVYEENK